MSRVLKKLFLGDVVAKGTSRQLRKLTTEIPQEDSIIGTWVFNDELTPVDITAKIDFYVKHIHPITSQLLVDYFACLEGVVDNDKLDFYYFYADDNGDIGDFFDVYYSPSWLQVAHQIITITGGADINNAEFITWLNANATRVEEESIVGTWRFNDTITKWGTLASNGSLDTLNITFGCIADGSKTKYNTIALYRNTSTQYNLRYDSYSVYDFYNNTWWNDYRKVITIVGGEDINNTDFIVWLKANATKIA